MKDMKLITSQLPIISPFKIKSNNYLFFTCVEIQRNMHIYFMFFQTFLYILAYLNLDTRNSLKINLWGKIYNPDIFTLAENLHLKYILGLRLRENVKSNSWPFYAKGLQNHSRQPTVVVETLGCQQEWDHSAGGAASEMGQWCEPRFACQMQEEWEGQAPKSTFQFH